MFQCSTNISEECITNHGLWADAFRRAKGKSTCKSCYGAQRKRKRVEDVKEAVEVVDELDVVYEEKLKTRVKCGELFVSIIQSMAESTEEYTYTLTKLSKRIQYSILMMKMNLFTPGRLLHLSNKSKDKHIHITLNTDPFVYGCNTNKHPFSVTMEDEPISQAATLLVAFMNNIFGCKATYIAGKISAPKWACDKMFSLAYKQSDPVVMFEWAKQKKKNDSNDPITYRASEKELDILKNATSRLDPRIYTIYRKIAASNQQMKLVSYDLEHASLGNSRYVKGVLEYDSHVLECHMIPWEFIGEWGSGINTFEEDEVMSL